MATSPQLERELRGAEANGGKVVVDLGALQFIDSSGVHALVDANRRCSQNGCRLSLRRGARHIQRVFELTSTLEAFSFDD